MTAKKDSASTGLGKQMHKMHKDLTRVDKEVGLMRTDLTHVGFEIRKNGFRLEELNHKLDLALEYTDSRSEALVRRVDNHEQRLVKLESSQ